MPKIITCLFGADGMTDAEVRDLARRVERVDFDRFIKYDVIDTQTLDAKVAGIMKRRQGENN